MVNQIFKLRSQGKSLRNIVSVISPIATDPRGGKWYATTISEILLNEEAYRSALRGDSPIRWPVMFNSDKI